MHITWGACRPQALCIVRCHAARIRWLGCRPCVALLLHHGLHGLPPASATLADTSKRPEARQLEALTLDQYQDAQGKDPRPHKLGRSAEPRHAASTRQRWGCHLGGVVDEEGLLGGLVCACLPAGGQVGVCTGGVWGRGVWVLMAGGSVCHASHQVTHPEPQHASACHRWGLRGPWSISKEGAHVCSADHCAVGIMTRTACQPPLQGVLMD